MNFDQLIEPHFELIQRKHRFRIFDNLKGPDCHLPLAYDHCLQGKPVDLENRLVDADPWRPKLVCFEAVHPIDGDVAPLTEICDVADLMVR